MPCSAACAPSAPARTGCHGTILRSKTTTQRQSRRPLVFSFCVLRRRINARTRRSVLRQGAHSPERVRYGPLPLPGGVGLTRVRAASDTACPKSRPLRSPLSRARLEGAWPEAEASRARDEAVSGSAKGSLISPAAPTDALAGTTSIVTSRSRCCAHAPDVPRTRIAPIAYRVNRFIMLPPYQSTAYAASSTGYMPERPALSISIFSRDVLLLPPCDRLATRSSFVAPRTTRGSCMRFPPSRKSVCQESPRRPP